jgi:predicted metalloprotease with PDZ domain
VLTSPSSIESSRADLLDTISHEFFHAWNVERIRPRSLEPFDFEKANMSGELWLAEGVTSYYAPLIMSRAGLLSVRDFTAEMGRAIDTVVTSPGRRLHSAVEMSQLAPFVDAAASIDRNNFSNTYISYYTWGEAIGLGLDLTLRERSGGKVTLDNFMRALWERFGKPGIRVAGYVETPYTLGDLQATLAAVSGDAAFAADFFGRYIQGREVVDYQRLLAHAGIVMRSDGRASAGRLSLRDAQTGARIEGDVPYGSPAYEAGLARGDVIVSLGGMRVNGAADVERLVQARRPGDPMPVVFERGGNRQSAAMRLEADPRVELMTAEDAGQTLTEAQRRFRDAWLRSAARNVF